MGQLTLTGLEVEPALTVLANLALVQVMALVKAKAVLALRIRVLPSVSLRSKLVPR